MVRVFPDKVSKGTKKYESRVTIKTAADPIIMVDFFFRRRRKQQQALQGEMKKDCLIHQSKKAEKLIETGQKGS